MAEDKANELPLDSFLAAAEEEMIQLLTQEQCNAVALWLKLYGDAFGRASPDCGRTVSTNFKYAANRLEIMGKRAKPKP